MKDDTLDRKMKINTEFKVGTLEYVTMMDASSNDDIGKNLVSFSKENLVYQVPSCRVFCSAAAAKL